MEFTVNLSLQQMALVKIAAELWNQKNIKNLIANYNFLEDYADYYCNSKWQKIEDEALKNVFHFPSPALLKNDLQRIIRPIGYQIKAWCTYHSVKSQTLKIPEKFGWTPEGTIDRKKTAEMLVKDENFNVEKRYKLACINCLEDEIPELWTRISKWQKEYFYSQTRKINPVVRNLFEFWSMQLAAQPSMLEGGLRKCTRMSDSNEFALELAISDGNSAATEYFFNKLSDEEKNWILIQYAQKNGAFRSLPNKYGESHSQVFRFLLSRMTKDQQIQTLTKFPYSNFRCLLDWPNQPFFMVAAEPIMNLICGDSHLMSLNFITVRILEGWTNFDYPQLLRDYWKLVPLAYKEHSFLFQVFTMLFKIFERGEVEICKSLFVDADAFDKDRQVLSEMGRRLCVGLIEIQDWRSLKVLKELCGPSKEVFVELKRELMERHSTQHTFQSEERNRNKWMTFFTLFDDLNAKIMKSRKKEDDNN